MGRFSLLILLAATAVSAQQATVMGITGKWKLGGKELRFGSSFAPDAVLACEPGSTIMIAAAAARISAKCDNSKTFALGKAAREPEPPGMFERLKAAVENFRHHETQGLIAAVSRGLGTELHEAVSPLRDGQADLAPAFRGVSAGDYVVTIAPLAGGKTSTIPVDWKPGATASARGLKPGLYQITLTDKSQIPLSDAWILVRGPADYAAAAAQFDEGDQLIGQWRADLNRESARNLRRALLESLEGAR